MCSECVIQCDECDNKHCIKRELLVTNVPTLLSVAHDVALHVAQPVNLKGEPVVPRATRGLSRRQGRCTKRMHYSNTVASMTYDVRVYSCVLEL